MTTTMVKQQAENQTAKKEEKSMRLVKQRAKANQMEKADSKGNVTDVVIMDIPKDFVPKRVREKGKENILEEKEIKENEKEHTTIITHGGSEKDMDSEEKEQITLDTLKTITRGETEKDTDSAEKE